MKKISLFGVAALVLTSPILTSCGSSNDDFGHFTPRVSSDWSPAGAKDCMANIDAAPFAPDDYANAMGNGSPRNFTRTHYGKGGACTQKVLLIQGGTFMACSYGGVHFDQSGAVRRVQIHGQTDDKRDFEMLYGQSSGVPGVQLQHVLSEGRPKRTWTVTFQNLKEMFDKRVLNPAEYGQLETWNTTGPDQAFCPPIRSGMLIQLQKSVGYVFPGLN